MQEALTAQTGQDATDTLLAYLKDHFGGADVITTKEFAKYMRISSGTLSQMMKVGTAPRIIKLSGIGPGRIFLYDMARWIEERGSAPRNPAPRGRHAKKEKIQEEQSLLTA